MFKFQAQKISQIISSTAPTPNPFPGGEGAPLPTLHPSSSPLYIQILATPLSGKLVTKSADYHNLSTQLCRKVGVTEFGLQQTKN